MTEQIPQQPLEVLLRMQRESLAAGRVMPEQRQAEPLWSGLAFSVGEIRVVTELTSVTDVVECPKITPVPRAKTWLRGIANVRGSLYSIVDLALFLGYEQQTSETEGRLLVLNAGELGCALLVPRIFGIRHFNEEQESQVISVLDRGVQPYAEQAFLHEGELWAVLDVQRLVEADAFRQVVVG